MRLIVSILVLGSVGVSSEMRLIVCRLIGDIAVTVRPWTYGGGSAST